MEIHVHTTVWNFYLQKDINVLKFEKNSFTQEHLKYTINV